MAAGATHSDDHGCELFEELEAAIYDATAALSAVTADDRSGISAEVLSKIWRIPIEQAERTLCMTTQLNKQDADCPETLGPMIACFGTEGSSLCFTQILFM